MHMLKLKYAITVAEMGSYSKAAEKLFISQPALSQSIRRLEDELQVKLFHKKNGQMAPTLSGLVIIEYGRKILELQQEMIDEVSDMNNVCNGTLTIGVSPFYQKLYLSQWLPAFQECYPGVVVAVQECYTQATIAGVINGDLDFGLISNPIPDTVYECIKVFDEEVLLGVPPNHVINDRYKESNEELPEVNLSDFKDINFISYRSGRNLTQLMIDKCMQAGFTPHVVFKCGSADSVNAMIANGMGVGFVPGAIAEICPPNQRAIYYRLKNDKMMRRFSLVCKKNKKITPIQQCFIKLTETMIDQAQIK